MLNLQDLQMLNLVPGSIAHDDVIQALSTALDHELQAITKALDEVLIIVSIDNLSEEIIDLLAWQFHVDFYEPLGLDLEKKRKLVKNSLLWHRHKGTKYVIEQMLETLFDGTCRVTEWFQYDGNPYFFRVHFKNVQIKASDYSDILQCIYELKNVRSWLEKIIIESDTEQKIYIAHVHLTRQKYLLREKKNMSFLDLKAQSAVRYCTIIKHGIDQDDPFYGKTLTLSNVTVPTAIRISTKYVLTKRR